MPNSKRDKTPIHRRLATLSIICLCFAIPLMSLSFGNYEVNASEIEYNLSSSSNRSNASEYAPLLTQISISRADNDIITHDEISIITHDELTEIAPRAP